jgi:prevent-host-death family protein
MKTITMTEFNQRVSAVTREVVDTGQEVVVTGRGRPVLRLVPELPATSDPLDALIAAGRATPPTGAPYPVPHPEPMKLSKNIDDVLLLEAGAIAAQAKSLDALHLASAQRLGAANTTVVTHDANMTRVADALGFATSDPVG